VAKRPLATVLAGVRRCIETHAMLGAGDRVLVAVSGGADSVGLLAVLCHVRKRYAISLVAAHVHHGLRGEEADDDESTAAAVAARLGVPFVRAHLGGELHRGANLEERAREARYRALHRLAAAEGCTKIATGHTRDDQAETVLLRLVRGAGPRGLAAIRPLREDGVIRPLLDCRRAEVEAMVRAAGLPFRHDTMNDDPRFLRTQVRARVLPLLAELNPRIVDALARTAAIEWSSRRMVEAWLAQMLASVGPDRIDVSLLEGVPRDWRAHVVRHWLARGGGARHLAARHLGSVLRLSEGGSGRVVALPGGRRVRRRGGALVIEGEGQESVKGAGEMSIGGSLAPGLEVRAAGWALSARWETPASRSKPADLWSAACDAEGIELPLAVRAARRGERVRPLGLGGSRKLSDVFIDRKIPVEQRASYPVVDCRGEILWVPGVVRAEHARVGPATRRVLLLSARPPG
jgi:tRNA(Ile)-lysidine synthase